MKVRYTTENNRLTFELEATTGKQAFEIVAAIQELFEEPACGCCKSAHIRCDVREFDGNSYYKLLCNACGAQLDFGQHKDGKGLFVKRTDKETKKPLPNRGWYVWQGQKQPATNNTSKPPFKGNPPKTADEYDPAF
jgi:hypothetical protein